MQDRTIITDSLRVNSIEFEIILVEIKVETKRHAYQYPSGALIE